jgi:hypothetical protein
VSGLPVVPGPGEVGGVVGPRDAAVLAGVSDLAGRWDSAGRPGLRGAICELGRPTRLGTACGVGTTIVLVVGGIEVAAWPWADGAHPDMSSVDRLARLQLAARRLGGEIRLRDPSLRLCELLALAGLGQVFPTIAGLLVEVSGETEGGEEIGVEEGVEGGDPVT